MKKYNSYHTSVKICYSLGIEHHILPQDFLSTIKPSTAHYWKNDTADKYVGSEFATTVHNNIDDLQVLYDQKVEHLKRIFINFCKVYLTIIGFIGAKEFQKIIRKNRGRVVDMIESVPQDLINRNMLCKFLKITPQSYQTWKRYQQYYCDFSLLNLCFKRVPQQISRREIDILKKFMNNKRFYHWSTSAVWGLAFKQGKTSMAESTWYRYAKLLGLTTVRKKYKKKRPRNSVWSCYLYSDTKYKIICYKTNILET